MTRVYVDLEVLSTGGGARRPVDAGAADLAAVRSLDHLVDAGHELVLVADPPIAPGAVTGIPGGLTETAVTAVPVEHGTGRLVPHVRRQPLPRPLGPAPDHPRRPQPGPRRGPPLRLTGSRRQGGGPRDPGRRGDAGRLTHRYASATPAALPGMAGSLPRGPLCAQARRSPSPRSSPGSAPRRSRPPPTVRLPLGRSRSGQPAPPPDVTAASPMAQLRSLRSRALAQEPRLAADTPGRGSNRRSMRTKPIAATGTRAAATRMRGALPRSIPIARPRDIATPAETC